MTKNTKSKNTKAEDSIEGGASEHAEAQHGAAAPAVRPEGAASDAPSATDTASASNAGEGPLPEATSSVSPVSPAPSDQQAGEATLAPLAVSPEPGAAEDGGPDATPSARAVWIVICSREGGKRRAGRRWAFGETLAESLTDDDVAALLADSSFEVQGPAIALGAGG